MPNPTKPSALPSRAMVKPALDHPDAKQLAALLRLPPEQATALAKRLDEAAAWVKADPARAKGFAAAPLATLDAQFKLRDHLPAHLGPVIDRTACGSVPRGVFDACVRELLQRALIWLGQDPAHRAAFAADAGAAIDAVAGPAPIEAIAIAKHALAAARATH